MYSVSATKVPKRTHAHLRHVPGDLRQSDVEDHTLLLLEHHVHVHTGLAVQEDPGLAEVQQLDHAGRAGRPLQYPVACRSRSLSTLQDHRQNVDHLLHEVPLHIRHAHHGLQVFVIINFFLSYSILSLFQISL
jgi:hypothetical protein